ncbi:MAG: polysaccharide biosynthesis C-terminal domain-containing protein, partial [Pseudomonadota bacterium]
VGITCVFAVVTDYAVAQGKAKQAFVRELAYLILQLPVFIWGTASYGYVGAVWASAFCGLLHAGSNAWLYTSLTKKGVLDLFKAVSRPLAAAFLMVVGVTVFQRSGLTNSYAVLIRLAAEGAVAAAVFCSSIYGLWAIAGKPYGPETKIPQLLYRGRLNGN